MDLKKLHIATIIIGGVTIGISIILLFLLFVNTLETKSFNPQTLSKFILYLIPLIIGNLILNLGRHWENFPKYLSKTCLSFSIIFFSIGTIQFTINSNTQEITNSFQQTVDTLIINLLENQNDPQLEQINSLISTKQEIHTIQSTNLTQKQINILSEIFNLNSQSPQIKEEILDSLISLIYTQLLDTNPNLIEEPIPINALKQELQLIENIDLTQLPQLVETNPNAKLIILIQDEENSSNNKIENLIHLRKICQNLNESQICTAIKLTNIDNLLLNVDNLTQNLGIQIPSQINSKLNFSTGVENTINDKTSKSHLPYLTFILLIFVSYLLLLLNDITSKNKTKHIDKIEEISKNITFILIPQILILFCFYLIINSKYLREIFQSIINQISNSTFSIEINNLPTFQLLHSILFEIIIIHIIIFSITITTFLFLKFYYNKK